MAFSCTFTDIAVPHVLPSAISIVWHYGEKKGVTNAYSAAESVISLENEVIRLKYDEKNRLKIALMLHQQENIIRLSTKCVEFTEETTKIGKSLETTTNFVTGAGEISVRTKIEGISESDVPHETIDEHYLVQYCDGMRNIKSEEMDPKLLEIASAYLRVKLKPNEVEEIQKIDIRNQTAVILKDRRFLSAFISIFTRELNYITYSGNFGRAADLQKDSYWIPEAAYFICRHLENREESSVTDMVMFMLKILSYEIDYETVNYLYGTAAFIVQFYAATKGGDTTEKYILILSFYKGVLSKLVKMIDDRITSSSVSIGLLIFSLKEILDGLNLFPLPRDFKVVFRDKIFRLADYYVVHNWIFNDSQLIFDTDQLMSNFNTFDWPLTKSQKIIISNADKIIKKKKFDDVISVKLRGRWFRKTCEKLIFYDKIPPKESTIKKFTSKFNEEPEKVDLIMWCNENCILPPDESFNKNLPTPTKRF